MEATTSEPWRRYPVARFPERPSKNYQGRRDGGGTTTPVKKRRGIRPTRQQHVPPPSLRVNEFFDGH